MLFRNVSLACIALLAIAIALWQILSAASGLDIRKLELGVIPITIFRPADTLPHPVIVIAHGFAGSQALMRPLAQTLARNNMIAVTFDFSGHGRNPQRLAGGIADLAASTRALGEDLGAVVAFAKKLPGGNGRLALAGHSMASDLVVQYAMAHPGIEATVALSLFGQGVTSQSPRNLLVIDGAWEVSMLTDAGFRIIGLTAPGAAQERVTYGDFASGTARRLALAQGVEHIGVLYARDTMSEARDWLNAVFQQSGSGYIEQRGPWLGLLFFGLLTLAFPLSRLLPRLSQDKLGASLPWRKVLPATLGPALLTPLLLWKAPTDFLPILLGDYLVVHFALYGALSALALWLTGGRIAAMVKVPEPLSASALPALAIACFYILVFGKAIDWFITSFVPTPERAPFILAMLMGTAPYFLVDEWLTRGSPSARGAYVFSKFCFLASLAIAIALNPARLFFLAIIVPAILIFFIIYGLISAWAYGRTHDPRIAALANALALAFAIAVVFPLVA